jgi:hypothetical protein
MGFARLCQILSIQRHPSTFYPSFIFHIDSTTSIFTMSFGVGVGDFLAIWELLGQIHKRFVDAPGQFKAVSNE